MTNQTNNFLDISEIDSKTLRQIVEFAKKLKAKRNAGESHTPLKGKHLAMIFEKNSTRTRASFEVGIKELGGDALYLNSNDIQLGRGETISDTAKVLSRYVDIIMLRANKHADLLELAENASVPIINGLTDKSHPCQIMADIMAYEEKRGSIEGKTLAWIGDGNNVAVSFVHAAKKFGFFLRLACPEEYMPSDDVLNWAKENNADVKVTTDPKAAVADADCVITDTWVSMGDTDADERLKLLAPYQVNTALMAGAKPDAVFMHCLPAHRGEEVTADVIDNPDVSLVWDEAENRLHAQKAVMCWCMGVL